MYPPSAKLQDSFSDGNLKKRGKIIHIDKIASCGAIAAEDGKRRDATFDRLHPLDLKHKLTALVIRHLSVNLLKR